MKVPFYDFRTGEETEDAAFKGETIVYPLPDEDLLQGDEEFGASGFRTTTGNF